MYKREFDKAIEKGLGRAYLYIKNNGDELISDQLLHYCLINPSYDSQCEESRAEWLISLIDLSKNKNFYLSKIIQALLSCSEHNDLEQLYKLCLLLAQKGEESAIKAIYQKFNLQEFSESYLGGEEIIQLDGLEGLLHVTAVIGKRLTEEDGYWESDTLYGMTCEAYGKTLTDEFLLKHAKENRFVKAYLDELKKNEERCKPKDSRSHIERFRDDFPIDRIINDFKNIKHLSVFMRFGKYATNEEIDRIYSLLLTESDNEKLLRYLWVFRSRELPKLSESINQLAFSNDFEIQNAAISALKHSADPKIRDIAIALTSNKNKEVALHSLELFINNFQMGDSKFIEPLYKNLDFEDKDSLHWICMDTMELFENNQVKELIDTMLWTYENTPCTHCRNKIARLLIENNWLPDTLLNECLYDCVLDTRNLAKATLSS